MRSIRGANAPRRPRGIGSFPTPATNHPNFSLRFSELISLSRFNRGAFAAGNLPLLELRLLFSLVVTISWNGWMGSTR
jgi:hypothetical protein